MSRTYLGVDPGLANCGFAVIEVNDDGSTVQLARGVIKPKKTVGREWYERFETIAGQLEKLIEKHRPAGGAVEGIVWHGPRKGVLALAQLAGAVYGFLRTRMVVRAALPSWVKENAGRPRAGYTPHELDALALARLAAGLNGKKHAARRKR